MIGGLAMPERLRTSLHAFADSLRAQRNAPLRGLMIGRFVVLWDGKPGDYMETASTDEVLGSSVQEPEHTDGSANDA